MRLLYISLDSAFAQDEGFLLSLPNLSALAMQGVFSSGVQSIYPTLTYPVHASLMTGCYPERHGIEHNEIYIPGLAPELRPWHWDSADIRVDTLLSMAAKAGRQTAAILWPTTGHDRLIRYNFPEIIALPGENQVTKVLRYGSTAWLLATELRLGSRRKSTKQPDLDDYATLIAEELINKQAVKGRGRGRSKDVSYTEKEIERKRMPDVLALHLVDLDSMRHEYGVNSPEAQEALRRLDKRVGRLINALEDRKILEETVIAVVSDHGQADVQGGIDLNAFFKEERLRADAQSLGFGAYIRLERSDYRPVLEALKLNREALGLKNIYTREELRELHADERILLAVEAEEGYEILENPLHSHLANHGFGPHHLGAQCLMWLKGPMFKRGFRLESCNLVDIAPTLAEAVHLNLPQAQGRVLTEAFQTTL